MNIYLVYISEHNLNHDTKIILLMIPNGEEWPSVEVKILSALVRGLLSETI